MAALVSYVFLILNPRNCYTGPTQMNAFGSSASTVSKKNNGMFQVIEVNPGF